MPKNQSEYVKNSLCCPFCNSIQDFTEHGEESHIIDNVLTIEILLECVTCNKQWYDIFTLTGYREYKND